MSKMVSLWPLIIAVIVVGCGTTKVVWKDAKVRPFGGRDLAIQIVGKDFSSFRGGIRVTIPFWTLPPGVELPEVDDARRENQPR